MPMTRNARFALAMQLTAAAAMAEVLLIVSWTLRTAPAEAALYAGLLWGLLKCLPLLIVIPGLLRGNAHAATWLCFILCFYFVMAVMAAFSHPFTLGIHLLEILLLVSGFISGLLATRWRPAPTPTPSATP